MGLRSFFGVARENEINEAGRWFLHATGRGWASVISFGQWTYLKCLLVVFIFIKIDESKLLDFIVRNRSVTFFQLGSGSLHFLGTKIVGAPGRERNLCFPRPPA